MTLMGHPARSWSLWAELGGLTVVPVLAGWTVGMTLRVCFELVETFLFFARLGPGR